MDESSSKMSGADVSKDVLHAANLELSKNRPEHAEWMVTSAQKLGRLLAPSAMEIYSQPLHDAARRMDVLSVIKLLDDEKVDVNERDYSKYIALHISARLGDTPTALVLVQHKADVNAQSNLGITPMHRAADYGRTDLVHLFLDSNADPCIVNTYGWNALHYASYNGHLETVKMLIVDQRVDIMAKTNNNENCNDLAMTVQVRDFIQQQEDFLEWDAEQDEAEAQQPRIRMHAHNQGIIHRKF